MSDAERPSDQSGHQPGFERPTSGDPQGPPPGPGHPYGQQPPPHGAPPPWQPYGPGGAQPAPQAPGQPPYGPQPAPPHGAGGPGQPPYGPFPGQPGQPYGQPGQPGPYGPRPAQGPSKSKLPLILGAAAVALLLVVVAVVAAVTGRDEPSASSPAGSGSGTGPAAPAATKASDAVQGYLEALAAKDADRALGYLDDPPADRTLLTTAVLGASEAAVSAVEVPPVDDEYAFEVPAQYRLGDQAVSEDFRVVKKGGTWKLTRAVNELDLSYQRDQTLPLLVNGVEVTTDQIALFPGTYAFTTRSKWLSYGDDATYTWTGPSDYDAPQLRPTLNSSGRSAFLEATKAAMDKCLAQRKLAPSGCPNRLRLRPGQKVDPSTIRWSLTNNPYKNARVTLDSSDPTVAEASFAPRYNFRARGTQDGDRVLFDAPPIGLFLFRATGDLSGEKVTVELTAR